MQCEGISSRDWAGKNGEEGRTPGEHGVLEAEGGGSFAFCENRDQDFVHLVWHVAHGNFSLKYLLN